MCGQINHFFNAVSPFVLIYYTLFPFLEKGRGFSALHQHPHAPRFAPIEIRSYIFFSRGFFIQNICSIFLSGNEKRTYNLSNQFIKNSGREKKAIDNSLQTKGTKSSNDFLKLMSRKEKGETFFFFFLNIIT